MDTTNNKTTSNFLDLSAATAMSKGTTDGCLAIVPSGGSLRTRLTPQLWNEIGSPETVEILQLGNDLVILQARSEKNAMKLGKGRYLYDNALALKIVALAGITPPTETTHVGRYTVQQVDANTKAAVITL